MRVPLKIRPLPGGATEYVFVGNVHCEALPSKIFIGMP